MELQSRIDRNVKRGPYHLKGQQRLAARCLFSFLAAVEEIPILAARRGDCIEGQLDDELTHRDSFLQIAERLGGVVDVGEDVAELIAFLEGLQGAESLALLNVTAEAWLESIVDQLAESGFCADLFRIIEAEEHRHSQEARKLEIPDPAKSAPLMVELEGLLCRVAVSPNFIVPLRFLVGARGAARMGLCNTWAHKSACEHLGLTPGYKIKDLEKACRAAIISAHLEPEPLEMNAGERSRMLLWKSPAPMQTIETFAFGSADLAEQEAEMVKHLGLRMAQYPELNRTLRGKQIYCPANIMIGVRREHSPGQIVTVYVENPQRKSVEQIRSEIRRKTIRIRKRPYEEMQDYSAVRDLLPPPRCSAVVTQVSGFGIHTGFAPLVDDEGCGISVCIGIDAIGTEVDHRIHCGREIGLLFLEKV